MKIAIALPTLAEADAVGNDVFGMLHELRQRGHDVQCFAWNSYCTEPVKPPEELPRYLQKADDLLIYHHSIGCEWAVKMVERFRGRSIVKYHNVTPPKYFQKLNDQVAHGCAIGLKQVARLVRSRATIWADSEFNAADVRAIHPDRQVDILPPFHHAERLLAEEPDYRSVQGLDDWSTNLLVVGRLVPNKNIPLAIRTFADYCTRFDPGARLIIVGDRPVPEHAQEIDTLIAEHKLQDRVIVTGKVSLAQLKALYLSSDCLLVTSHHEGFCVPIVEAMGLRIPVVAVPNTAIPFTGGETVRYAADQPEALAAALHETIDASACVVSHQLDLARQRYQGHFSEAAIRARFNQLWNQAIA